MNVGRGECVGQCGLLNQEQAAVLLGVSPRTVWVWGRRGWLRRVRVGVRLVRYRVEDINRLVREDVQ